MKSRPFTDFPRSEQGLVDNFIGTAYDTVKHVADNMTELTRLDGVLANIEDLAESTLEAAMVPIRVELQATVDHVEEVAASVQENLLVNATTQLVTAKGTEGNARPDRDTLAGFAGRNAYMALTKVAFAPTLTNGTNIIPMSSFVGSLVNPKNFTRFRMLVNRQGLPFPINFTYNPATDQITVTGAVDGDLPIAVEQDVGGGDISGAVVTDTGNNAKYLSQWIREAADLRNELASSNGVSLVGGALRTGESLTPTPSGTSLTRGAVHAYYAVGALAGAVRIGGSDLTSLNDEGGFWRGLPSQNSWGDPANIGFCSAAFNRNGASVAAYSTTFGHDCVAYGTASIAFGAGSCTGNPDIWKLGGANAGFTGYCSIAGGKNVYVPGQKAVGLGEAHFIDSRAGVGLGYMVTSQPSVVEAEPTGAAGIGREIKLYGQAYGFGAWISASNGMVIGYGANSGSPLTPQLTGEVGIGSGTIVPAIRVERPINGSPRSQLLFNRVRAPDPNLETCFDVGDGKTLAFVTDGFGQSTVSFRGLKTDGTSQPIFDIEWTNPNGGSSVGTVSLKLNGRSSSALKFQSDGTPIFGEIKAEGQLPSPVVGALYYGADGTIKRVMS